MTVSETLEGSGRHRVRARILYPFALVVLFVITVFVVTNFLHEDSNHKKILSENVTAVERLFRQGFGKDAATMHAVLVAIARDESIKRAFMKDDREALLKRAWPMFDELRQSNMVTHR